MSAKENLSRAWGVGEGEGGKEARFVVFYVSGRLSGLTEWCGRVCPLKKDLHVRGGRGRGRGWGEKFDLLCFTKV